MGQIMDFNTVDKRLRSHSEFYIQTDKEFYYCAGKLVKYILTKHINGQRSIACKVTWNDHEKILYRSVGNYAKPHEVKQNIIKLIKRIPEALSLESKRMNNLLAAVMAYECESEEITNDFNTLYTIGGARNLSIGNINWKPNDSPSEANKKEG